MLSLPRAGNLADGFEQDLQCLQCQAYEVLYHMCTDYARQVLTCLKALLKVPAVVSRLLQHCCHHIYFQCATQIFGLVTKDFSVSLWQQCDTWQSNGTSGLRTLILILREDSGVSCYERNHSRPIRSLHVSWPHVTLMSQQAMMTQHWRVLFPPKLTVKARHWLHLRIWRDSYPVLSSAHPAAKLFFQHRLYLHILH